MSATLTAAEVKALGSAVYNWDFLIREMHSVPGITPAQIEAELVKFRLARKGLRKLRSERKAIRAAASQGDRGKT